MTADTPSDIIPNPGPGSHVIFMRLEALKYAHFGTRLRVFPCIPGGKRPLIKAWQTEATTDRKQIEQWWTQWPDANIGIACGKGSGIIVLDVDAKPDTPDACGLESLKALTSEHGPMPDTLLSRTGGGGLHYVFQYAEGIRNKAGFRPGLDIRGEGGYIIAPPSIHESGNPYLWEISPAEMEPAPMPPWLLDLITAPKAPIPSTMPTATGGPAKYSGPEDKGGHWLRKALDEAKHGTRNETGFWLACQLRDAGISESKAEFYMGSYQTSVCNLGTPEYTEAEMRASLRKAYGTPPRQPARSTAARQRKAAATQAPADSTPETSAEPRPYTPAYRCEDIGNSERFVSQHGRDLRYVEAFGKWLSWDGKRWELGPEGAVVNRAKRTVKTIYQEAANADDLKVQEAFAAWAKQSAQRNRIQAMIALAGPDLPINHESLDDIEKTGFLFNVENGTLDLKTGELRPHKRDDFITNLAPVKYDHRAECPTWLAFLDTIMGGNADLIRFLQKAVGYSLTGDTGEHVMFLLHGGGRNGKSTFLETIRGMLGSYAQQAPADTFMVQDKTGGGSNDVARLRGSRFVSAVESEEGKRLATSLVKQLTGGDMVAARFLYREFFEYRPSFKWWLGTNHLPRARGDDFALFERIKLVPFAVTIAPEKRDQKLPEKLRRELPGILKWAVDGCIAWQAEGLGSPKEVTAATAGYKNDMDTLGQFIEENCTQEPGGTVTNKELYTRYVNWCEETREYALKQKMFSTKMQERPGVINEHSMVGRVWRGIRLKDLRDQPND